MPTTTLRSITPTIDVYVKLAQYPILADTIRTRMREDLFRRGVVSQADFEREVQELAIDSQRREGVYEPYTQEETDKWELRKERIREVHTDAYFANSLGIALLEQIIQEVLSKRPVQPKITELTFNPEIAPWELLFRQGEIYEALPEPERKPVQHHLEEIKVVLIKRMISDQLPFIGIAKNVLTISDLRRVYRRLIGGGKIGGKAAGIVLAWKILREQGPEIGADISHMVQIPESYFIGSQVIYDFSVMNNLDHYMNQKYRPIEEIRSEYPKLVQEYLKGKFPESIVDRLREILVKFRGVPLIVRSSSLLEDNFGFSFAGKYVSIFCPNQGSDQESLEELLNGIRRIYASLSNPDALLYRKKHDLLDYDERMCVIIQPVLGDPYGHYLLPSISGVAYSHNPYLWNPNIRRDDGFMRLVWGLGTRAVNRADNDYPRLVALSHPQMRPDPSVQAIRQYSQHLVDVLDLDSNTFETLHIDEVLGPDYPNLNLIASIDRGDYLQDIMAGGFLGEDDDLVITFNKLTEDKRFVKLMRMALFHLERSYGQPVDVEFIVEIIPNQPRRDYQLHILQCRPLSQQTEHLVVSIPEDIPEEDILFETNWLVSDGKTENIRYVVFIDPVAYKQVPDLVIKRELGRAVCRLNQKLKDENFILMGPGRWGSSNLDLGVHVTYGDIYNTKALVEIGISEGGSHPELSLGTHFFNDLVESRILALALWPDEEHSEINWSFFRDSANSLAELVPEDKNLEAYLRVIDIAAVSNGRLLHLYMDGDQERAVAYLGQEIV
ncbi:MAG: PEP/pyruvate-binding domain-containing protein [Candidatus Promineifilaceae bacterium]|jgi:hypothetical protein